LGKAALHLAAERGHEQVADVLLNHKAYVGAKSKLGMTPLHLAAENGYTSLVEMLVYKHKAQVDANTVVRTYYTLCLIDVKKTFLRFLFLPRFLRFLTFFCSTFFILKNVH